MRYTGTQHTQQEAEAIMRETRVRLRSEKPNQRDEGVRRRDHAGGVVRKTNADARAAPAADEHAVSSWTNWVDQRIEERAAVQCEAIGEIVAGLEDELAAVRSELKLLRDQVDVERKITALNAEVARARSQAPDFKSDLSDLQEDVETLRKNVGALRAQHSTLEFKQRQATEKVTMTRVELTSVGARTREVLERLRASGFDLTEMGSSGLLS